MGESHEHNASYKQTHGTLAEQEEANKLHTCSWWPRYQVLNIIYLLCFPVPSPGPLATEPSLFFLSQLPSL